MDLGLSDKIAVVLASTAGLGRAVAESLLAEGAHVAISGRSSERLAIALEQLEAEYGDRVCGQPVDVTVIPALHAYLDKVESRFGRIDILVLNSGGPPPGTASEIDIDALQSASALLLQPMVAAIGHVLPGMRERRFGRILGMTSIAVRQPIATLALSNTLRAGLTGYLKTLSLEVASDGVLVNTICTGMFDTARLGDLFARRAETSGRTAAEERAATEQSIPVRRIGKPNEYGDLVAFLASERASYINGVAIAVDGGAYAGLL